jgi:hypothetical protein
MATERKIRPSVSAPTVIWLVVIQYAFAHGLAEPDPPS